MTINILAVRRNAQTISTQAEGWNEAYATAKGILAGWHNRPEAPIEQVFLSDGNELRQFTPEEIGGM
jgi:hypothetical protein